MNNERKTLINLRQKINLTQNDLADDLGVAQQTISQLENGSRDPSLKLAKKIELYFDTPMEEIFPDLFNNLNTTQRDKNGKYSA